MQLNLFLLYRNKFLVIQISVKFRKLHGFFFTEGETFQEDSDYTDNALENLMRAAQQK